MADATGTQASRLQHRREAMSAPALSNDCRFFVLRTHAGGTPAFQSVDFEKEITNEF
jgi:hypothetical protein